MTIAPALLDFYSLNLGDWLMRGLAVIGAAALGGFVAGLIVQLTARFMAARKAPPSMVRVMRILGAITVGVLVAFLLFRTGGPGGGGSGIDGGKDSGKGAFTQDQGKDATKIKEQTKSNEPARSATALRIEVLGGTAAERRHYRIEGDDQPHTLDEVRERLVERRKQEPPLEKLIVVLYEDSSDKDTQIVRNLIELARDNGLTPDISEPKGKRP